VTEPVDRTYDMLQRVGEFLKNCPPASSRRSSRARRGWPSCRRVPASRAPPRRRPPPGRPAPARRAGGHRPAQPRRPHVGGPLHRRPQLTKAQLALLAGGLTSTSRPRPHDADPRPHRGPEVGHRLATDAILSRPAATTDADSSTHAIHGKSRAGLVRRLRAASALRSAS